MAFATIRPPYPSFFEANGTALEDGYIWIGEVNKDPQANPLTVYWDAALTQPVAQPVRTINGYASRNGSPGTLFVNNVYSIRVQNKKGTTVYTDFNVSPDDANFVNFTITEEIQTATAGQTVFTLTTMSYTPATNNLNVFVDGVNQISGGTYSYTETNTVTVTFASGLHEGALVKFTTATSLSAGTTDAANVVYYPAGTGAVATNVQAKLRESVSSSAFLTVQETLDAGTSATSYKVKLVGGLYNNNAVSLDWPTTYQTTLIGDGSAKTIINTTNTDGTQAIEVAAPSSDSYHAVMSAFKLQGGATAGDGIHFNSTGIGPMMNDIWVRDFSGSGKAGVKFTSTFIGTVDNLKSFSNDVGVSLVGSNGIIGRGWWVADNVTMGLQLDATSKGNDLSMIELGLSATDATKKAISISGSGNLIRAQYYENYTAPRSISFSAESLGNKLDFLHSAPWTGAWDDGAFNVYPVENHTSLVNLTSSFGFGGHLAAGGNDIENRYTNSTWNNSSTVGWNDFSITPPTRSVDTTIGYLDTNSMKLDWGTTALSGVESAQTFAVSAGDVISVMMMVRANRDLESTEELRFILLGAGNENREIIQICDLRQDLWTPVILTHTALVSENVNMRIVLGAAATHTALITYHDDFVVQVNKKTIGLLRNDTASTAVFSKNGGLYLPKVQLGRARVSVGGNALAGVGGTLTGTTSTATIADTNETVLYTHSVAARALWKDGQAIRIKAFGSVSANANTKQVRVRIGGVAGTLLADTTALAANNKKWTIEATLIRTGATTQVYFGEALSNDAVCPPTASTAAVDLTAALDLVVTGTNGTAAANDIVFLGAVVEYLNMGGV